MSKRYIVAFAISLCCVWAWSAKSIEWLGRVHDFGAFSEDDPVNAYFKFVNTGDEPVVILKAAASCGCTVPHYDQQAIAPGDTATITVTYNPVGRPGRFEKSVYVLTDASHERMRLVIRGAVIGNASTIKGRYPIDMGALKLHNGVAMLGRVYQQGTKSAFIDGYNQSADTLRPQFHHLPPYLSATATPEIVPPGEQVSIAINYLGENNDQWGMIADSISVQPTEQGDSYWLQTVAIVEEDFSAMTDKERAKAPVLAIEVDRIDMGKVADGSTASLQLTNRGKSPLLIRRLYSPDGDLECSIDATEVRPGCNATISVKYLSEPHHGNILNSKIIIITNDPSNPSQTLRVVGTL